MAEEPRRGAEGRPRLRLSQRRLGELPFALVLGGVALGLLATGLHHFKRGSVIMGAALLLGALLRLLLPEHKVGMLAVRGRLLDVVTLFALGVLIVVAALIVPPP